MVMLLVTSGAVILLTGAAYFTYEIVTFRQVTQRQLETLGQVIATNSTAALAFNDRDEAEETLRALAAARSITGGALYDRQGNLFARFVADPEATDVPARPGRDGVRFEPGQLILFHPVEHAGSRLGTLFLRSDLAPLYARFRLYGVLVGAVAAAALLLTYFISRALQRQISEPVLVLADTAQAISARHDYSVRAPQPTVAELAALTDAFNHMLAQIERQNLALRDSEGRLRAVLNSSLNAAILADEHGRINDWSARAEQVFGWTRQEALGRNVGDLLIPPRLREAHRAGFARALALEPTRGATGPVEFIALRRDGSEFPVELSISVLRTGARLTYCSFFTDITERKRAQEKIERLNDELEQRVVERTSELAAANHELEAFSYSVSHDLRAPLRHIDGFAALLVEHLGPTLDPTAREYLSRISKSSRRMSRLIEDLLQLSRQGRVPLQLGVVDLNELISETRQRLEPSYRGRVVLWQIDELPPVWGDASLLMQVFVNLLDNALKYSGHRESATIEIGLVESTPLEVILFVRDNGAGFDMRYVDRLFGVFQRLHTDNRFEGTGVGLAVVRRIVQRHGGRVWAESAPESGATFFVALRPPPAGTAVPDRVPPVQIA